MWFAPASTNCVSTEFSIEAANVHAKGCACTALETAGNLTNAAIMQFWHNIDLHWMALHGCVLTDRVVTTVW